MFTHDMGDTVGGELLARSLDGNLAFAVSRRVLTNGSIYIDMAHLSTGQQLLLAADDAPIEIVTAETFIPSIERTFSEHSKVDPEELEAQWLMLARNGGNRLLAAHDSLHRRPAHRRTPVHGCDRDTPVAGRCGLGRRRPDRDPRR